MTTPDHALTDDERESMDAAIHASLRGVIDRTRIHEAVETILAARVAAARFAAVEAGRVDAGRDALREDLPSLVRAQETWFALSGLTPDHAAWTDWLAAIGYGIDFSSDTDPPCTLRELAKAMHRANPSESVETWEWCVTENTGAFTARAEAVGDDHA